MSTNQFNRQHSRHIVVDLGPGNMGTGNGVTAKLPQGTLLKSVTALGVTAFNSETTATLTVGDGTTTYVNAQSIATTGSKTVANVPKFYPTGGTLTISLAQTGNAATAGRAIVEIEYLQLDVNDEVYG